MRQTAVTLSVLALAASTAATAAAQSMPTTQPKFLQIYRDEVKAGRAAEHAAWEAGWAATFERAKSPYTYLALASMTGPSEVLYLAPYASQAAYGESLAWEASQPGLTAETDRLAKGDAEFVSAVTLQHAMARPELSHGSFPDLATMRFWEITTFRVRPGHEASWIAATNAYKAAAARSAPNARWRTYEVVAGAPGGTYLVFSSVAAFSEFDRMMAEGEATWKGMTAEESAVLSRFMKEGLINTNTNRYRLDPRQSYVDAATRAKDPAFWNPKQ